MTSVPVQISKIYIIEDEWDVYDMEHFTSQYNKACESKDSENSLESFFLERLDNYKCCPIATEQYLFNQTKGDPDIHKKWRAIWDNKKEGKKQ